ncbi:MAG: SpaA isopeptide-forming pilin-related protein [Eubacterium sp.]
MIKNILKEMEIFQNRKKKRNIWKIIISVLACIVVFCTTYALILPAITLEKPTYCGKNEHIHTDECFDVSGNVICSLEEHTHIDECYLENKAQSFSDTQTEENAEENTEESTEKTTDAAKMQKASSNETSISAQTDQQDYGYNDDDSIWWKSGTGLIQITDIAENTPYLILGYAGNNLMADETFTKQSFSYLKAIPKEDAADYNQYKHWYFEKADENGNYYIYFMKDDNSKLYLQFGDAGVTEWNKPTRQLILVTEKAQATVFNVGKSTQNAYKNHYVVSAQIDSRTYYLNSYFGDKPLSNGNTTHWLAYPEYSEGSFLKICQYDKPETYTANRLNTENTSNTVINLFDYWTKGQYEPDHGKANDYLDQGINENHNMKFYSYGNTYSEENSPIAGLGTMNKQEAKSVLHSGIVQKKLVNGYPVLSGDETITGGSTESLDYLFNPQTVHEGKESYRNVEGLLRINDEGYHYFNSQETMAEFNSDENNIFIYDKPGVVRSGEGLTKLYGQFFPFNCAPQIMLSKSNDQIMNHYFGLTLTTRFAQRYGGYTDINAKKSTTFSFSGDDDVWIFIDNVLVADLGGCHDSVGVDIDFSTGEIKITYSDWTGKILTKTSTLYDEYAAAGATESTTWNGKTYADNSAHTMKFFYMERGNWDSNLYLKYNLTEIPETAIYKVDQYGNPLADTDFAVYAADTDYNMLSNKDGQKVDITNAQYDENGNIVDGDIIIANALYKGTTDKDGKMAFLDPDGLPYSLNELEDLFGQNFIVREIKPPEGFRTVSENVDLQIWHGANQIILRCDNTMYSGARASSNLQITATDTIHLHKPYNDSEFVLYCDEEGHTNGTLFAVVFKYTGKIDNDGNAIELDKESSWTPVYGNDKSGYELLEMNGKGLVAGAIETAQNAQNYGNVAFSPSSSGAMQLTLVNLPGHISTYYRMLDEDTTGQTRYTVGYYWTDQDDISKATDKNTYRVDSYSGTASDGSKYPGFERIFGANIHIPNLVNDVYVEKTDESNHLINGAKFALYKVEQQSNGEIHYLTDNGTYTAIDKNAMPDSETGAITSSAGTITPFKTEVTQTLKDGVTNGTAVFGSLPDGQYIIKEIKAPSGYTINKNEVMLLITPDTIYANAGTADDGITVGRGPGYVVNTLNKYASEGMIDNTLSWIYAQLKITGNSTSFADAVNPDMYAGYLTANRTGNASQNEADAVRSYLKYNSKAVDLTYNYEPNTERIDEGNVQNPSSTRRLFTTTGWSTYEIYQDYEYGIKAKPSSANYENWSGQNLTPLFSRSTYIRVADSQETSIAVKKVDSLNTDSVLADAQFRLYRIADDGKSKEYYFRSDTDEVSWVTNSSDALVVKTKSDGLSDRCFTKLKDGEYYLEEIKPPHGYNTPSEVLKLKLESAKLTLLNANPSSGHKIDESLDNNLYTYTVTIPNSPGYELPETGGIGTVIFYVIGGVLVAGAVIVLITRRRMAAEK